MSGNTSFKEFYYRYQVWLNVILIAVVGMVLVWGAFVFMDIWTKHGETSQVPNVGHRNFYEARAILEDEGFKVEVDSIFDPHVKHGQVIDQSPKPGEVVKYGRTVYLKINSFFPEMKSVDDNLLHISSIQAQRALQSMGFTRIIVKTMPGDNDDEVIDIRYDGRKLKRGTKVPVTSEVTLYVTRPRQLEADALAEAEDLPQEDKRDSVAGKESQTDLPVEVKTEEPQPSVTDAEPAE